MVTSARKCTCVLSCCVVRWLQVVKNAMEPLDCTTYPDGRRTMDANPEIECDVNNFEYARLRFWAIVCLCVYGIGIPLAFVVALVFYRKEIIVDQVGFKCCKLHAWSYLLCLTLRVPFPV